MYLLQIINQAHSHNLGRGGQGSLVGNLLLLKVDDSLGYIRIFNLREPVGIGKILILKDLFLHFHADHL